MRNKLVILAMAGVLRAATPQYTVAPIVTPAGWTAITLSGLNNLGQIAGIGYNGSGTQAVVLTAGSATPIPQVAGLVVSEIDGINDYGLISGCCYLGAGFVGTVNGVSPLPQTLGPISGPNGSGQMASTCLEIDIPTQEPCIVTTSGITPIPLPANFSNVVAESSINNAGRVAGTAVSRMGGQWQAIVGTPAGSAAIPLPPSWPSSLWYTGRGINNAGHVVAEGTNAAALGQAFIWSGTSSAAIPLPPGILFFGVTGEGLFINDSDVVVGPSDDVGWWIWDRFNGTRLLNPLLPSSWSVDIVVGINNLGQILAETVSPQGVIEYILLTPVAPPATPAPATLGLTIAGLALLALPIYGRFKASASGA